MITQVTTTDSAISIPPKTGIVNAVLHSNCSNNSFARFVFLPPFLP